MQMASNANCLLHLAHPVLRSPLHPDRSLSNTGILVQGSPLPCTSGSRDAHYSLADKAFHSAIGTRIGGRGVMCEVSRSGCERRRLF